MKFVQPLILSAALVIAFASCRKESIPAPVTPPANPPAVTTLEAVLKFNGNLSDSTGKITSATPSGNITYANDRNGNANSALYLDGATKVTFAGLNIKGTSMTMSAWIKYTNPNGGMQIFATAFNGGGSGPVLSQVADKLGTSISVPSTNSAVGNSVDANWHHLAVTYDGNDIKVYVDGVLAATTNHPGTMSDGTRDLIVGFFGVDYWTGYIDELRVYNIVLPAKDIQQLAAM